MATQTIHVMCTCQVHSCSKISDSQIDSVSESLSASANYLRKLVEGQSNTPSIKEQKIVEVKDDVKTEDSTISVHADSSYDNILKGFTIYDSKEVDTPDYKVKREHYDLVRQNYPNLDNLIRDDKIKAMKELKSVGFRYYSIQVTAFVEIDGMTRPVKSKSHHRLKRPSKDYLKSILEDTFKGSIRKEDETSKPSNKEAEDSSAPNQDTKAQE